MSPEELEEAAEQVVAKTTAAQGVPYHVDNPDVLAKVARLLLAARDRDQPTTPTRREAVS